MGARRMSQREGAPKSTLSSFLLRLVGCAFCRSPENEWGPLWEIPESRPAPEGLAPYDPLRTRRVIRAGWDHRVAPSSASASGKREV